MQSILSESAFLSKIVLPKAWIRKYNYVVSYYLLLSFKNHIVIFLFNSESVCGEKSSNYLIKCIVTEAHCKKIIKFLELCKMHGLREHHKNSIERLCKFFRKFSPCFNFSGQGSRTRRFAIVIF